MHILQKIVAALAAFLIFVTLLITTAELAIYQDFHFYQKEYEKYDVLHQLDMEMEEVMYVTKEMMAYLHGKRENLNVQTTVNGKKQEFFNSREKAHMKDVKQLFMTAINIRYVAVLLFVIAVFLLKKTSANWSDLLFQFYWKECLFFFVAIGGIAFLFAQDFNRYFLKFHELFFQNDLWLLDPNTDLMIRMLPEGFFFDFAMRIGMFVGIGSAISVGVCFLCFGRKSKK